VPRRRFGEFDDRKKVWKRRASLILVSGTLDGKFARRATIGLKRTASRRHTRRRAHGPGNRRSLSSRFHPSEPTRITIDDAVRLCLANREPSVAHPTHRKYKTCTKQLVAFADSLGYVMLDQFRPADIDWFYTNGKLGPRRRQIAVVF
jgi:hypothetical protein